VPLATRSMSNPALLEAQEPLAVRIARSVVAVSAQDLPAEVADKLTGGPANLFPGNGKLKFDDNGHRENAGLLIVQWQKGVPITVFPAKDAISPPIWPKQ